MLEIFSYSPADYLPEAEEAELIEAAQHGNESAKVRLIDAYGPSIRSAVRDFGRSETTGNSEVDVEDLQSSALLGFLTLIGDHDLTKNPRLAGRVAQFLTRFLDNEMASVSSFSVPSRTLSRFYGLLSAHDGDAEAAEADAPAHDMARDTFRMLYASVRGTGSLDGLTEDGADFATSPVFTPSPVVDVEDRVLVDQAFKAVNDAEARIIELAYGFTSYGDPMSDDAIGETVGASRPAVQRQRLAALRKMRKVLCVVLLDEAAPIAALINASQDAAEIMRHTRRGEERDAAEATWRAANAAIDAKTTATKEA